MRDGQAGLAHPPWRGGGGWGGVAGLRLQGVEGVILLLGYSILYKEYNRIGLNEKNLLK